MFDLGIRARFTVVGAMGVLAAIVILVMAETPLTGAGPSPAGVGTWCTPNAADAKVEVNCRVQISPSGQQADSLRSLAQASGIRLGSAANTDALANDPQYAAVLGREFNSLAAEDAMKWARVEPAPGVYNWAAADRLVNFAQRNGQQVYGHALVWYSSLPRWLEQANLDRSTASHLLQRHIDDEVSRYRGKVWAWDVVNEPLDTDGTLRDSVWLRTLGQDYIADSFRYAHEADPVARLFLNDYGIEGINAKSTALYSLVRRLLAKGVPIDGVGFQTHWTTEPLPRDFVDNLQRFAALGLDIAITEADVRIVTPATPEKLQAQAGIYLQAINACLAVARCVSFTVWGYTDKYSWIPNAWPDSGSACLYDANFRPKPAYTAVAEALVEHSAAAAGRSPPRRPGG